MLRKCRIINEIFSKYNNEKHNHIIVFTKGFKAIGEFSFQSEIKGVITLKKVKIFSYATNCECETNPGDNIEVAWLNIFAQDIIAFSFIPLPNNQ